MTLKREIMFDKKFPCPVCGCLVLESEVCETCNWENTGILNIDGGPNEMLFSEAL